MNPEPAHDLPILTDVVELKAQEPGTAGFNVEEQGGPGSHMPRGVYTDEDVEALRVEVTSRALGLTEELLHNAARDIEAVLFERVHDRLRAALPDMIAAAVRDIDRNGSG
jgi:hypothetical protein